MENEIQSYSYSKLKSFYNCKYYYYINYYEKSLPVESHGTSEFGSLMHEILEKYSRNELQIYDLLDYYKENYNKEIKSSFVLHLSKDFSKDMEQKYYENGLNFLSNFEGWDFQVVAVEDSFDILYKDKFKINGRIDLICKDDENNLIVIDHKSKGKWKNKKEKEEYKKQLYFYCYAIKKKYGKYPKKMAFFMFRMNHWEWFDFSLKEFRQTMKWAENTVEEIESEIDFSPSEKILNGEFDFFCSNFCSFRNSCKYGNLQNLGRT